MPEQKLACPKCQKTFTLPVEVLIAPEGRVAMVKCPDCLHKSPVIAFVDEVTRIEKKKMQAFRDAARAAKLQAAQNERNRIIEVRQKEKEKEQQDRAAARVAMQKELRHQETAMAIAQAIDAAQIVPTKSVARSSGNKTKLILAILNVATVLGLGTLYLQVTKKDKEKTATAFNPLRDEWREMIRKAATSRGMKPQIDDLERATDFAEVVIRRGRVSPEFACTSIGTSLEQVPFLADERAITHWESSINDFQNFVTIASNPDARKLKWITQQSEFDELPIICPGRSSEELSIYVYRYLASKGNPAVDRDRLDYLVCSDHPFDTACKLCAKACCRFADGLNEASFDD